MNIYKHQCSICGKMFQHNNKTIAKKIKDHIKDIHNMDFKDYLIKTFFDDNHPTCHCGCGKKCSFHPKDALWSENHGFSKYYNCGHVSRTDESKYKSKQTYLSQWSDDAWVKQYYNEIFGLNVLQSAALDFINGKSALDISKEVNIDARTLRSAWIKLKLLSEEELKKISLERKCKSSARKRRKIFDNSEEIIKELFEIASLNPQKYNIRTLIKYYNKNKITKLEVDPEIVYRNLIETYGNVVIDYLQFGYHSQEEMKFMEILFYYFNKKRVKCGFPLYYGNSKREYYAYDFCVDNKLLIEYDGKGYYHNNDKTKKHDKIKEEFAIEQGYKILRISDVDIKKPELIIQIKQILQDD